VVPAERAMFTARLDSRCKATRGRTIGLVIEPSSMYFFDPDTEVALR
jgi:hypothetical protein